MLKRPWLYIFLSISIIVIGMLLITACIPSTALPVPESIASPVLITTTSETHLNLEVSSTPSVTITKPSSPISTTESLLPTLTPDPRLDLVPFYIIESSLSWDPSGNLLAYTTSDGRAWLQSKNAISATEISGILAGPPATLKTLWSPDGGKLLVYGVWGFDYPHWTAMWLVLLETGEAKQAYEIIPPNRPQPPIFQNEGVIYAASWASDGESISYSFNGEAWIYDLKTRNHEQVTQIIAEPLMRPGQVEPFDGVREVEFSPDDTYLAIGLSCNCPSPFSGVGILDLENRETKLIESGRLTGWSSDNKLVIFENITGDWAADYTFDVYGANPVTGKITNLTRSNPDFDQLLDPWKNNTPSAYQARSLRWMPDGSYLYITLDYHISGGPAMGFIIRQSPQEILLEKMATAKAWYIFPNNLPDGRVGYIEAEPRHPDPVDWTGNLFEMRTVVSGADRYEVAGLAITNAVWTPDGSTLALVVVLELGKSENRLQIFSLK